MSHEFAEPLSVRVVSSPILNWLTRLLHGGALALVPFLSIPVLMQLALAVAIVAAYFLARRPGAVEEMLFGADGDMAARMTGEAEHRPCRLTLHALGEWLVTASVRIEGRRRSLPLVLAADSIEPETFRRLRARLRRCGPAG